MDDLQENVSAFRPKLSMDGVHLLENNASHRQVVTSGFARGSNHHGYDVGPQDQNSLHDVNALERKQFDETLARNAVAEKQ